MIVAALLAAALSQAPVPDTTGKPGVPAAPAATDPTPAQLFRRAIEAVGPISQAPCLRAEGVIESDQARSDVTLLWNAKAPRRIVVRERLHDGRLVEWGCNGERGWMRVPGRETTVDVEPAAVLATKAALVPSVMVMALADRFTVRTGSAPDVLDGVRCRRVDLEDRDGLPGAAWFDADTGRLRAFRTQAARDETPTLTTIEAWAAAGPLQVPAKLVSRTGDRTVRTTFARLSTDPLPDELFAPSTPR